MLTVAQLDMSLMRVLHGVGGEVREHLLDTSLVDSRREGVVWIVLDKFYSGFLYTLGKCLTDIIEYLCKVTFRRFDGKGLPHARCFKNIVDEAQQHIAVITDNANEFYAFFLRIHHWKQIAETYNGIQWRSDLMCHVGEENAL